MSNACTTQNTEVAKVLTNAEGFYRTLLTYLSRAGKFPAPVGDIPRLVAEKFKSHAGDIHEIDLALRRHGIPYKDRDLLKSFYGLSIVGVVPEYQMLKNLQLAEPSGLYQKIGNVMSKIIADSELLGQISAIHPELWKGGDQNA